MKNLHLMILRTTFLLFGLLPGITTAQPVVTSTDLAGLKTAFNSLQGYTRILFMGDPTCGGCMGHANDLRNQILNQCDNPDLRMMIVWANVPGFTSVYGDAVNQAGLWSDSRASFFWDTLPPDVANGFGFQGGWSGCNYAWDFSTVYLDTASWAGIYPPAPYYCISKTGCCNSYSIMNEKNQLNAAGACTATRINESFTAHSGIEIFPNPASNEIHINIPPKISFDVSIFNALGVLVSKTQNHSLIDISFLACGIYVVQTSFAGIQIRNRFVKE